jgi:hypothetical protein
LTDNNTYPELINLIIDGLSRWRTGDSGASTHSKIPWLHNLGTKQDLCGWRNFFEGLLVTDWRDAVKHHFDRTHSMKSPKRWLSALIRKMWLIAWDLWEHRNGYLHDQETSILVQQINTLIAEQFDIGVKTLDAPTKALFKGGLQVVLAKPLDVKQQWHRRVLAARQNASLGQAETYQSERKTMARWLGTHV